MSDDPKKLAREKGITTAAAREIIAKRNVAGGLVEGVVTDSIAEAHRKKPSPTSAAEEIERATGE